MVVRLKVKNIPKQSNNTALGVMQNKKVCIWALERETLLKSKLHSPPQADHNWKPINAFPTCLGRQMEVVHVSALKLVPSIRIISWASEMSLHSWKKTGTGLGGRAVSS